MSKIRRGPIFVSQHALQVNITGSHQKWAPERTDIVSYSVVCKYLQAKMVLVKRGLKWGAHTIRKTAFYLMTYAGAGAQDPADASRLRTVESVGTYRADGVAQKNIDDSEGRDYKSFVDAFRSQNLRSKVRDNTVTDEIRYAQVDLWCENWGDDVHRISEVMASFKDIG